MYWMRLQITFSNFDWVLVHEWWTNGFSWKEMLRGKLHWHSWSRWSRSCQRFRRGADAHTTDSRRCLVVVTDGEIVAQQACDVANIEFNVLSRLERHRLQRAQVPVALLGWPES